MPETITFNVQPKRPWQIVLVVMGILLLVSLAGNVYLFKMGDGYKKESDKYFSDVQAEIQKHIDWTELAQVRIDSIHAKRIRDSLSFKSRETALKIDLERSRASARKLRPTVQAKIDSSTDLRAFVGAQDSVIQQQDSLIRDMEQHHIGQILDLQAIIKEKTSQIMAQIAVSETLGQVVTNLEQDVKKEKRKKNFFKVVSGVLAGGIVFLSLKE